MTGRELTGLLADGLQLALEPPQRVWVAADQLLLVWFRDGSRFEVEVRQVREAADPSPSLAA